MRKLPNLPRVSDPDLYVWMKAVHEALSLSPPLSYISTTNGPNVSGVSAERGTIGVEVGSSRTTALWVKSTSTGTNNWKAIV